MGHGLGLFYVFMFAREEKPNFSTRGTNKSGHFKTRKKWNLIIFAESKVIKTNCVYNTDRCILQTVQATSNRY